MTSLMVIAWLAAGLIVTLATQWLAARIRHSSFVRPTSVLEIVTTLLWAAIVMVGGIVAGRYIERTGRPVIGYTVFGLAIVLLSLVRGLLLMGTRGGRLLVDRGRLRDPGPLLHAVLYLVLAVIVYFVLAIALHRKLDAWLMLAAWVGTLLPDLDSRQSVAGRVLPFVSRRMESGLGHREEWHSLAANLFVAAVTLPLVLALGWTAWLLISLGFLAHLLLDLLDRQGLILLWPVTRRRYRVAAADLSPGTRTERRLLMVLVILAGLVGLVSAQAVRAPAPLPAPTYDETVRRYLGLRGNVLVFADVNGTWQIAGQRVYARFEILNALGSSFILLDRTTGAIFSAGRGTEDDLYLNGISLVPGAAVRVKPVERRLAGQTLAELLPVIYEMQNEPGLQYIFISGDVVLPAGTPGSLLAPDYAQARLRNIVRQDDGRYTLRYLTAAELVGLADVQVETADVMIVATYAGDENAATATPLPSPPAPGAPTPEAQQGAP